MSQSSFQLDDEFAVKSDSNQWILCKVKWVLNQETGEKIKTFVAYRYFGSLKQLFFRYYEELNRTSDYSSLQELINNIEENYTKVFNILNKASLGLEPELLFESLERDLKAGK